MLDRNYAMEKIRVLFIGDVVGETGRDMFQKHIDKLKERHKIDAVIVNGENSSGRGRGISSKIMRFFKHNNADIVTSGNHVWDDKEIYDYLNQNNDLLRPANYPAGNPGSGVTSFLVKGHEIGVINLQGRVFMRDDLACPFRTADSLLTFLKHKTKTIFVDFHAEASSEKIALALYLDGRVSGLVGTHTHAQTADEQILPKGTAFITDLGYTGSLHSTLGMKKEAIISRFLTQMPSKFVVEKTNPVVMSGVWIEVDMDTGRATAIERIRIIDQELFLD